MDCRVVETVAADGLAYVGAECRSESRILVPDIFPVPRKLVHVPDIADFPDIGHSTVCRLVESCPVFAVNERRGTYSVKIVDYQDFICAAYLLHICRNPGAENL